MYPSAVPSSSSSSSPLLSPVDYSHLSVSTGIPADTIARRLSSRTFDFRLSELKEIIKYLKGHPAFAHNSAAHRNVNSFGTADGSTAKKHQYVEQLKVILQTQQQQQQPQSMSDYSASFSLQQQQAQLQAQQQAQFRAQQQAAQQAAQQQRFQADPYRYPPGSAASSSSRPLHPYSYSAAAQPLAPQQFAYTSGTSSARDFTQYANASQQQRFNQQQQQQQAQINGFGAYGGYSHPQSSAAAAAAASSFTHPALQTAQRTNELDSLSTHPNMPLNRSPYEQIVSSLGRNLLNSTSSSATTGGSGAYHTTLTFNVPSNYLSKIKRTNRVSTLNDAEEYEVHLRLFSAINFSHTAFDARFRVLVNGAEVKIPEPKKLSKTKKKGLELVRGLDIGDHISASNTVEVSVYRPSYSAEIFRGLVTADLIRYKSTSDLMEQWRKRVKDEEGKMQATALERACIICGSKKEPLRCSRCKSEWYCGAGHQREHWTVHRENCQAPTPEQDAAREAQEKKAAMIAMLGPNGRTRITMPTKVKGEATGGVDSDLEDGIEEVDALVSLKCALSLERCEYPARGKNCHHLSCFNLETFLMFSQQSGVWQCFADDTQLLTNQGFVGLTQIKQFTQMSKEQQMKKPMLFATYHAQSKQLEYQPALRYIFNPYDPNKRMIEFNTYSSSSSSSHPASSPHLSLLVTDEHDMYVSNVNEKKESYAKHKAGLLLSDEPTQHVNFISAASNGIHVPSPTHSPSFISHLSLAHSSHIAAFLELYGYWLSAGSIGSNDDQRVSRVIFIAADSQQQQWIQNRLEKLELKLNEDYHEESVSAERVIYAITTPSWCEYFSHYHSSHASHTATSSLHTIKAAKSCFEWVWQLNVAELKYLIAGLLAAENELDSTSSSVSTSSPDFRDELIRLFLHAGYAADFVLTSPLDSSSPMWSVRSHSTSSFTHPTLNRASDIRVDTKYSGGSWCVSVPNGLVIARRVMSVSPSNSDVVVSASSPLIVGQCPVCYAPLPWEEIEVNLQMMCILRETDGEIAQIRVHPDGQYDPIKPIPDGESGDGREPSRKRKQPTSNGATAPTAKVQATGGTNEAAAAAASESNNDTSAAAAVPIVNADGSVNWTNAANAAASSAAASSSSTLPAAAATATAAASTVHPSPSPSPSPVLFGRTPSPAPTSNMPAGTADEPIELD